MARGTITDLVRERGFGTISADGLEFFFNRSALQAERDPRFFHSTNNTERRRSLDASTTRWT